jgi:hypothetical protein
MLAQLFVAAAAFHAPTSVASNSRVGQPAMMAKTVPFWERADWIEKQAAAAAASAPAAPAAAPAATASMSVPEACTFLADPSVASVSFAEKKTFLESKGVSAFVIAEAACTAPDTTLVL